MENKLNNFIQSNSPDGGFLQSSDWRKFQESVGRKTFELNEEKENDYNAHANIITHSLPIAGKYFYVPRGPVLVKGSELKTFFSDLIELAGNNSINWIRVELSGEEELNLIHENLPKNIKIKKSAVDVQPRDILMMDISKSDEDILAQMKQKTRYNIKLAEKKGVKIYSSREEKDIEEFLRLVDITAKRDKITTHPGSYYRKMFEIIPPEVLKLYVAEYEGKIIAANLVLFFGKTATYMHGASASEHRNLMAPYLLQWQQIVDAKKTGCARYDFGGVKIGADDNSWSGITKFKTGFAPDTKTTKFPGSYDIILKLGRYKLYRALQKVKRIF